MFSLQNKAEKIHHVDESRARLKLVLVQILAGNVVLRDLTSVHFPCILIVGFLHSRHRAGFKDVAFFNQLIDAFRIRLLGAGQTF